MQSITKLRATIALIILSAFGIGALWLAVPAPEGLEKGAFYSPFGTPTTLVDLTLAIGGGVLFLYALAKFKKELKPAWKLIALAQLSLGTLTLVFPIIEYYYLWDNIWWNMSSYLGYFVASILMFFGVRKFYAILNMRSRLTSAFLVSLVIFGGWALHAFIPHPVVWWQFNELQYDLFELIPWVPVVCYAIAAYLAARIRFAVGREYTRAFSWLAIGLSLQALSCISIGVLEIIGYENWYFSSRAYVIPTIAGDMGILAAAYYFNAVGLSRKILAANSTDIITYAASLASSSAAIDPLLDDMRIVTSGHAAGQALSSAEQQRLEGVYLKIEAYLTAHEPLREFNQSGLRRDIEQRFRLDNPDNASRTFWPHLTSTDKSA